MKRKMVSIICLIGCLSMGACGGGVSTGLSSDQKRDIEQYSDWTNFTGVIRNKAFPISYFLNENKEKKIGFAEKDSEKRGELVEIIRKHNQYVEENRDCFADDHIEFRVEAISPVGYECIFMNMASYDQFNSNLVKNDLQHDAKIRSEVILWEGWPNNLRVNEFGGEFVELLQLNCWTSMITDQESYDLSFLETYPQLKYLVFQFYEKEYQINNVDYEASDFSVLYDRIHKINPNIKMYVQFDKDEEIIAY